MEEKYFATIVLFIVCFHLFIIERNNEYKRNFHNMKICLVNDDSNQTRV